jgi:hypothetical protein
MVSPLPTIVRLIAALVRQLIPGCDDALQIGVKGRRRCRRIHGIERAVCGSCIFLVGQHPSAIRSDEQGGYEQGTETTS